jgi:serine/threonine protein kinase/tetratricopeptide (TPR) repeat protein
MIGTTISHYEIIKKLGEGGMGVVYKALDTKLNRPVAIKFLPASCSSDESTMRRFIREAQTASALDHPNICTIHEIDETPQGQLFIVMAAYAGMTLEQRIRQGPIRLGEAVEVTIQAADGLGAAHKARIIHRDIKPSNIFLTQGGHVRILDFGLAHRGEAQRLTEVGTLLGTLLYMSPEQAQGMPVDQRTDLWALGVVFYEMLAQVTPFQAEHAGAILARIVNGTPVALTALRPDLPLEVDRIIDRALAKNRDQRYGSAKEMATNLRALKEKLGSATGKVPPQRRDEGVRIAVLPFSSISADARDEYFADGMTEELILRLSRINRLRVIARTSVLRYKGTSKRIREIGHDLRVGTVLEGSVRKAGSRVRVAVQLIDAASEEHVWSGEYDRDTQDVFTIQADIAQQVADALQLQLAAGERRDIAREPTASVEAYEYYLRGLYYFKKSSIDHDVSIMLLERAVELDSKFALGHAALARAYTEKLFSYLPEPHWQAKAEAALERALKLEPALAEAHVARGNLLWTRSNRFPHQRAIAEYRQAIMLKPNLAEAHAKLGRVYQHIGLFDDSARELVTALEIDPAYAYANELLGLTYIYQMRYEDAIQTLKKVPRDLDPDWMGAVLVQALFYLGRTDEAKAVLRERLNVCPDGTWLLSTEAIILAREGEREQALDRIRRSIESGKGLGHYHHTMHHIASAYALMGEPDSALQWLELAAGDGLPCQPLFASDPNLEPLRGKAKFEALLARLKEEQATFTMQWREADEEPPK